MASPETRYLGVGVYTASEAARLLRVPAPKLRRWATDYTFQTPAGARFSRAMTRPQLQCAGGDRILSFLDLIELRFVAWFREVGVPMPIIRAAADEGRRLFGTDHPFAVKQFSTDGRTIFTRLEERRSPTAEALELTEDLPRRQMVFGEMVRPYLKRVYQLFGSKVEPFFGRLDVGDHEVFRYWPQGKDRPVVIDPRRAFGKPIDAPSGVPTFTLYQASLSGEEPRRIAEWYGVTLRGLRCAIAYEESLLAA